ncbi:MAG: hypothetical protein COC06_09915 [Bacteroidales bacterium]|nr:MAG: hypothetical protein COC06_09915 [Bacteroidales bacterium]
MKKIIFSVALILITVINVTYLTSNSFSRVFNLKQLNFALADGYESDPIDVYPTGTANTQSCTYWTTTITGGGSISGGTSGGSGGVNGSYTRTEHRGTMTICVGEDNNCDYVGCH